MKAFKNIVIYSLAVIFILLLTASYQMDKFIEQNVTNFSLKSSVMQDLFYENYDTSTSVNSEDEQSDPPMDTEPVIKEWALGDSGEEVYEYEKILYYLDYKKSEPSGNFGEDMSNAVKAFQEAKELETSGDLDTSTIQTLLDEPVIYSVGKEGEEIKEYQLILYYLDYLSVYPEGVYGTITVNSVKKYQQSKGLEISGDLDIETQESLKEEKIIYKSGKQGDMIKEYQTTLISLGYLDGNADGKFGNKTTNAVKKYQEGNNLEVNGTIDIDTQTALEKPTTEQVSAP